MSGTPELRRIDGVNWVERDFTLSDGSSVRVSGLTVRAFRAILQNVNPDALVAYLFESPERLNIGVIAGLGGDPKSEFCLLFGPEAVPGLVKKCEGGTGQ